MRIVFVLIVVFSACVDKSNDAQVVRELKDYYNHIADQKFERAEITHRSGHELRLKEAYHHLGVTDKNLTTMIGKLDKMFAVVEHFYHYADSLSLRYAGERNYPIDQLISSYVSAIDSLHAFHRISDSKLKITDFRKSAYAHSPELTIARMKADVAENGHQAMYAYIDVTAPHAIYDDFSMPSVRPLYKRGSDYAFTIHYRTGQSVPDFQVEIDTIIRNKKIISQKAFMHHDDILWVLSFDKLKKGDYEVRGRVRAVTDKLDVRPFTHRFQIL